MRLSFAAGAGLFLVGAVTATVIPDQYIVQLSSNHTHEDLWEHLERRGAAHYVHHRYEERDLFHGAAIELSDASHLHSFVGVLNVFPVEEISPPDEVEGNVGAYTEPRKLGELSLLGSTAPKVTNQATQLVASGITGKGIKVAVIDTGIDYRHPLLGLYGAEKKSCLGSTCKVLKGYDFSGKDTTVKATADADPFDDCTESREGNHATAVAGVIGANAGSLDSMNGVAPNVKLLSYRTYPCKGGGDTSLIIAAIAKAIADGAHIINISLGSANGWSTTAVELAVNAAVAKGVAVFVAAANDGEEGATYSSSPGSSVSGINVGAFGNGITPEWRVEQPSYGTTTGPSYGYYASQHIGTEAGQRFRIFTPELTGDGCPSVTPSGYINPSAVLIVEMPKCAYRTFFASLKAAGADVVLGYLPQGATSLTRPMELSSFAKQEGIRFGLLKSFGDGQKIIKSMYTDIYMTFPTEIARPYAIKESSSSSRMSAFSSIGPTWDLQGVVSLSAAGGTIPTLLPTSKGSFGIMGGTSFASPYAAGCAALFYEARASLGSARLARMRQAFVATALPIYRTGTALAPLAQAGAGRIAVWDAVRARTFLSPSYINLGDVGTQTKTITVENTGSKTVKYTVTHRPATDLELYPSASPNPNTQPLVYGTSGLVTYITPPSFTVAPGKKVTFTFKWQVPAAVQKRHTSYSGFIQLASSDGLPSVRVPYSGVIGKMKSLQVIDRSSSLTGVTLPAAVLTYKPSLLATPLNTSYSIKLNSGDLAPANQVYYNYDYAKPAIVYRRLAGTLTERWSVIYATSEKVYGHLPGSGPNDNSWSPRTAWKTGDRNFEYIEWDGVYRSGGLVNVPEVTKIAKGPCRLRLSALKPGGTKSVAADWEVWTSPILNYQ